MNMKRSIVMALLAGISLNAIADLDRVYYTGPGFTTLNINSNAYQALAEESLQAGPILIVMGSLADGSGTTQVISRNWGSSWEENPINSVAYSKMATRIGVANQFYGLKADGSGIDLIYFFNNAWQIFSPPPSTDNTYKAIAADATDSNRLFAARRDGTGVDRLFFNGSVWVVDQSLLSTTDFSELETMTGVNNSFYGIRADGSGLGRVVYSGGWVTLNVVDTAYKALAADATFTGNGILMVYGARADGTGVDRIRSNDWGVSWYVDFPQLTTRDYDVLSTMHGVANQFYGSTLSKAPVAPQFTSVTSLGDGTIQLDGIGPTNAPYRVFATTNLSLPFNEWEELGSSTFTDGVLNFTDLQAPNHARRFYRAVTP
jgi:hypothetical protein